MKLFDTHCHINDEKFSEDAEDVLKRMQDAGVRRYAVVGSDMASSLDSINYADSHHEAIAVVGIHPHEAKGFREEDLQTISEWTRRENVKAIGEIGLDYFYDLSPRETQKEVCIRQMELAYSLNFPVVYHIRDAHQDMLDIMKSMKGNLSGGIIHCFSGSWEIAKEYLKLGYYISFAGPVTFRKAPKLTEAALNMPIDRILIETDSPYLAPEPVRGRRNEPSNVRYICRKIAELRGMDADEFSEITYQNALNAYRIEE